MPSAEKKITTKTIKISPSTSEQDLKHLQLLADQHADQIEFKKSTPHKSPHTFTVHDQGETYQVVLENTVLRRGKSFVVLNDFRGEGTYGKTYGTLTLSRSEGNFLRLQEPPKPLIVKRYRKNFTNEEEIQNEVSMFNKAYRKKAQGEFCDLITCQKPSEKKTHYFFMPDFGKQTLEDILKKEDLDSKDRYLLAILVTLAVKNLHDKGIVHQDLKPANIMIDQNGEVKIIDFGFAREKSQCALGSPGTPEYVAPEIISSPSAAGKPADIFSLSRMFCAIFDIQVKREMIHEKLPNPVADPQYQLTEENRKKFKEQFENDDIAEHVLSVHKRMSALNPKKRPRINLVLETLLKNISFLDEQQQALVLKTICSYSAEKLNELTTEIKEIKQDTHTQTTLQQIELLETALAEIQTYHDLNQVKKCYSGIHSNIKNLIDSTKKNKEMLPSTKEKILYYLKYAADCFMDPFIFLGGFVCIYLSITPNEKILKYGFFGTLDKNNQLKSTGAKIHDATRKAKIAIPEFKPLKTL